MRAVIKHRGQFARCFAQGIVLHDDNRHASHGEVLLCSGVDGIVFGHIYRPTHNIRAHIGNQQNFHIKVLAALGTVNRVVGTNMQIVGISRDVRLEAFRIGSIAAIGRRSHLNDLAEELGFFHSLLGPHARIHVSCFLNKEVGGYLHELQRRAAAQKDDRIACRNIEQLLEQGHTLINNGLKVFGAMTDFHQRKPAAVEIQ